MSPAPTSPRAGAAGSSPATGPPRECLALPRLRLRLRRGGRAPARGVPARHALERGPRGLGGRPPPPPRGACPRGAGPPPTAASATRSTSSRRRATVDRRGDATFERFDRDRCDDGGEGGRPSPLPPRSP